MMRILWIRIRIRNTALFRSFSLKKLLVVFLRENSIKSTISKGEEEHKGYIEFDDAEFSYPSRPEQQVLRKLQLALSHGERIALVGQSGCGKSTIIQLIQASSIGYLFKNPCIWPWKIPHVFVHCPKNNLNLRIKIESFTSWADITAHLSDFCLRTVYLAQKPPEIQICSGQCVLQLLCIINKFVRDSVCTSYFVSLTKLQCNLMIFY